MFLVKVAFLIDIYTVIFLGKEMNKNCGHFSSSAPHLRSGLHHFLPISGKVGRTLVLDWIEVRSEGTAACRLMQDHITQSCVQMAFKYLQRWKRL